jgi:hypothetical protein
MIVKADAAMHGVEASHTVAIRCPSCRRDGTFDRTPATDLVISGGVRLLGQRLCPHVQCRAHVFFVYGHPERKLLATYPAERLDFDASNVPAPVVAALEEAITCLANNCFTAAAIMVRKTLEVLCEDRKVSGANLKERIAALGSVVVLPKELLAGLDDLRLLGNDAAHVESQVYNTIGQEEVEVGIEFTKEVLKAVYQYSALVERLRKLKKT